MDYDTNFRSLQTALTHCNEFVMNFDKITYFGGNEIYMSEISSRLKNVLSQQGFDSEESPEWRRINLFLMLNTNIKIKYDLNRDNNICHLLNNFPQLSKCLYANLAWELMLDKYLYEAIKFTPSWFMLEFLEEVVDSLRFSKTYDVIRNVKELVEAIYTNICRMDYRFRADLTESMLEKLIEHISTCLRHYNTPCADPEIIKSKKMMRAYLGHSLNHQLSMVISCLAMYHQKPKFNVEEKFQIYRLMQNEESETNNFSSRSYSSNINETLNSINTILFNTLQNSLLNVTLDDFMYWVEIDIEDNLIDDVDLKRDNLQKSIGQQAYILMQILYKSFEHDVVKQLETIAIKPKTLREIASEATIGTVLEKIETSLSRKVWLEELLDRKSSLYCNTECLQTVIDNSELIELKYLLRILNDHLDFTSSMDAEDEAQIREIFLFGGKRLSSIEILEFTEELIRIFGDDYSLNSDIEDEFIKYLNKTTDDELNEESMWKLIFQHPQKFYEMLLDDINIQDESQISTALKIISETRVIAVHYIQDIVINNLNVATSSTKTVKHLFLSGVFKLQIMERREFVRNVLMQNFSQAISTDNLPTLLMLLRVLYQISNHLKIDDLLSPLMIQLAQILDKYRWDIMSYSTMKEDIVDITASIIAVIIKAILKDGSKNDKEWIKARVENCKPVTKYYFQKLSLEKGDPIVPLDLFLYHDEFSISSKSKITTFLCETIVRCTSRECKRLMNNEILQNFFTDALIVITVIASKSNEENPLNCLHKCVADYVKILMVNIIPNTLAKDDGSTLLKDMITLLKRLPAASFEEFSILFLEPLKLLNKCSNFSSLISELEECELKRVLLE